MSKTIYFMVLLSDGLVALKIQLFHGTIIIIGCAIPCQHIIFWRKSVMNWTATLATSYTQN